MLYWWFRYQWLGIMPIQMLRSSK